MIQMIEVEVKGFKVIIVHMLQDLENNNIQIIKEMEDIFFKNEWNF